MDKLNLVVNNSKTTSLVRSQAEQPQNREYEQLLQQYLSLDGSTTTFLRDTSTCDVTVKLIHQSLNANILLRESLLFVECNLQPILYAKGFYYLDKMTEDQKGLFTQGFQPAGDIFGADDLKKLNCRCSTLLQSEAHQQLELTEAICYRRQFDLYLLDEKVAELSEFVSLESLSRLIK